jgi:hypothetical protein
MWTLDPSSDPAGDARDSSLPVRTPREPIASRHIGNGLSQRRTDKRLPESPWEGWIVCPSVGLLVAGAGDGSLGDLVRLGKLGIDTAF